EAIYLSVCDKEVLRQACGNERKTSPQLAGVHYPVLLFLILINKQKMHTMKLNLATFILVLPTLLFAQAKYLVYFTDKNNSPYSVDRPSEFLSPKSIERREKQRISIKPSDLPVNKMYADSLRKLGLTVWYTSKWFNAAYIAIADTSIIKNTVDKLAFVKKTQLLIPNLNPSVLRTGKSKKLGSLRYALEDSNYGESFTQASQICADEMHKENFRGEGMTIAVLDGGFTNANDVYFLDSVFYQNRILGTHDFVENDKFVYSFSDHGTNVLSCIGGYAKGKLIGTAYKANFYLFRTEDGNSEYPVEEANWLMAAERADSLGADVINSSLGYTSFDDSKLTYKYRDRDGRKPISSLAATMAARTGMICVISAGNGGDSRSDPYISAPGDADSVLTVGAIDKNGEIASFSSYGPSIDGRTKPEVVALGVFATIGLSNGSIGTARGTSFSAPIMTGMVAGLWQSLPDATNMEIIDLVKRSGDLYQQPNAKYGYGTPCFFKARLLNFGKSNVVINDQYLYPNPFTTENLLFVVNQNDKGSTYDIEFFDISAKSIFKQKIENAQASNVLSISSASLTSGLYFVRISTPASSKVLKLIKN
ncbi:MAG: S8 family serine peptidase, partial [Cytophagales bacterium]